MNFICKELTVDDDGVFGCSIGFFNTVEELDEEGNSLSELDNSEERYFLVQRSYAEDFDEEDYYYVETSESDRELSYKDKLIFKLRTESLEVWMPDRTITIGLNLSKREYDGLKRILKKKFKDFIILRED